ncbi:VOC family protein [Bradyrhizobium sp. BEA-2-5]|uniref:VOC family protein n=1 Tax=Bradyrhizobium TaxID=374 RepID=UPI00067AC25C|nr:MULTISPECIES: VOC family protein [Bradyrhizobium]WOH83166.1 VOC family protein [Bradyrhizobium sp. BEA-2-5]
MSTEGKKPSIDMKLEVVVIPVSDVDRAKRFYENLGWRLDADFVRADGSRALQLTPPGSPTSLHLDKGSALPRFLIVSDIEAARADLIARGVDVSEVFHRGAAGRVKGPDPERPSYGSLATFNDPDGNVWLLQQVTQRLPGRVDGNSTTFASSADLAAALRRAAAAHGDHEKRTGGHDVNWPDWYADYIVREQAGKPLPE